MKVAFIGHRKIDKSDMLKDKLTETITDSIINKNADTFLFGSRSEFNDLCYEVVTRLKAKYPYICRVFVRAEYEYINNRYADYLQKFYEETFFAEQVHGAGILSYIKRNQVMIDNCDILVAYFDAQYKPSKTKSGTKIAVEYAQKKGKYVLNLFEKK